jgi:hypothetical protein
MGIHTILIWILVVIDTGGAVDHQGLIHANAFEAVEDKGRYLQQQGIMVPHKKLVHFPVCGRSGPRIIQHYLHHAFYHHHVIGLLFVIVPALYHSGICAGEIYLAKFNKQLIVCPQHLHQSAALVRDDFQILCLYTVNSLHFEPFNLFTFLCIIRPSLCDQIARPQQRFKSSRVSPPAVKNFIGHSPALDIRIIDIRDLKFSPA